MPVSSVFPSDPKYREEVHADTALATGMIRLWVILKSDSTETKVWHALVSQFVESKKRKLRTALLTFLAQN